MGPGLRWVYWTETRERHAEAEPPCLGRSFGGRFEQYSTVTRRFLSLSSKCVARRFWLVGSEQTACNRGNKNWFVQRNLSSVVLCVSGGQSATVLSFYGRQSGAIGPSGRKSTTVVTLQSRAKQRDPPSGAAILRAGISFRLTTIRSTIPARVSRVSRTTARATARATATATATATARATAREQEQERAQEQK